MQSIELSPTFISSLITAVITIVMSLGWYLRRERTQAAKAREDIAASNASTSKHEGQAAEIESLRSRIDALDKTVVEQAKELQECKKEIAKLQALLLGVSMHFGNMLLCDDCKVKNKKMIEAIEKTLETALAGGAK